jgi:CRP-like cAMP-binding protein
MMLRTRNDDSPLVGVSPFDQLAPEDLRPVLAHTDRLRLARGTVLARENERAREVVVVTNGEVIARRAGRVVGRFGPGTQIGARAVLDHDDHTTTVVAGSDVEVVVVNGPAYRWAASSMPPERRTSGL